MLNPAHTGIYSAIPIMWASVRYGWGPTGINPPSRPFVLSSVCLEAVYVPRTHQRVETADYWIIV